MHHLASICLLLLLLLTVCCRHRALADMFVECNVENDQHFIASNKSCVHFILCNGEDSYEGECGEGDFFNADQEMCEFMNDIDCRTGQVAATTPAEVPVTLTTSVVPTSTAVSVPTQAPAVNLVTSIVTSSSNVVAVVAKACPFADNPNQIVLLPHDKSCTEYFICYNGKPLAMSCAASLHFDAKTGKCDRAEIVNCMTSAISVREQCKTHTVDIYPHPDNCNYFYFCRNGFLMLQQCPFFFGWDYEKRSCVAIRQAKCFGRRRP